MEYRIESTPTVYEGVRYRSRHEARWACTLTRLNLDFRYETFSLPGWLPDFFINAANGYILAEVKPFRSIKDFDIDKYIAALMKSRMKAPLLMLGYPAGQHLGWLMRPGDIEFYGVGVDMFGHIGRTGNHQEVEKLWPRKV